MANDPDRDITTTLLAAAPIQIVARRPCDAAGRRGDCPEGGTALALPPRAEARVELRIGERLWGQGELVDLDGQLAVRLTRIAPSLGPSDDSEADTVR